jgi:hypothetical protein
MMPLSISSPSSSPSSFRSLSSGAAQRPGEAGEANDSKRFQFGSTPLNQPLHAPQTGTDARCVLG